MTRVPLSMKLLSRASQIVNGSLVTRGIPNGGKENKRLSHLYVRIFLKLGTGASLFIHLRRINKICEYNS